jgi:hypothetical protein
VNLARKNLEEMVGDGFREVGVLVFVFSLLERLIKGDAPAWWIGAAFAIATFFFLAGCYVERRRPE